MANRARSTSHTARHGKIKTRVRRATHLKARGSVSSSQVGRHKVHRRPRRNRFEHSVSERAFEAGHEWAGGVHRATHEVNQFASAGAAGIASFLQLMMLPFTIVANMTRVATNGMGERGDPGAYGSAYFPDGTYDDKAY